LIQVKIDSGFRFLQKIDSGFRIQDSGLFSRTRIDSDN